jgi:hypothetical protein
VPGSAISVSGVGKRYSVSNPYVSSDLIALLRHGLRPDDQGRPLEEVRKPFWRAPARQGPGTAN